MLKQRTLTLVLGALVTIASFVACTEGGILGGNDDNDNGINTNNVYVPVCERSSAVIKALSKDLNIQSCEEITADDLKAVHRLSIVNYPKSTLKSGDLSGLSQLDFLAISGFESIPNYYMANLPRLKELRIEDSDMSSPAAELFAGLNSLEILSLRLPIDAKVLKIIDSTLLPNLIELYIRSSSLNEIAPGDLDSLAFLKDITIHGELTILKRNTFDSLTKLENLSLSENNIQSIEVGAFNNLSSLKILDLSKNAITLKTLNQNGLFSSLPNLIALSLHTNYIEELDADIFENLKSLEWLALGDNRFKIIPANSFIYLTNLKTLVLLSLDYTRAQIEKIEDKAFAGLTHLEVLHLSNLKLTSLSDEVFSGLDSIKEIDLHGNKSLKSISDKTFMQISDTLEEVSMAETALDANSNKILESQLGSKVKFQLEGF